MGYQRSNTMNTEFNVTATKGDGVKYHVEIEGDVLEGLSEATVLEHARANRIVNIQNYKQNLLRYAMSPEDMVKTLAEQGFTATVTEYVSTTPVKNLTPANIKKAIDKGHMTKAAL